MAKAKAKRKKPQAVPTVILGSHDTLLQVTLPDGTDVSISSPGRTPTSPGV